MVALPGVWVPVNRSRPRMVVYLDEDVKAWYDREAERACVKPSTLGTIVLSRHARDNGCSVVTEGDQGALQAPLSTSTHPLEEEQQEPQKPQEALELFEGSQDQKPKRNAQTGVLEATEARERFEQGWKLHRSRGGRMGRKDGKTGRSAWRSVLKLMELEGWSADVVLLRWTRFLELTEPKYVPEVHRLLNPANGKLTDDLDALEIREGKTSPNDEPPPEVLEEWNNW